MTRRTPLRWIPLLDGYAAPDCGPCADYLATPNLVEAFASVGIEHGGQGSAIGQRFIERYHEQGHKSEA